MFVDHRPGESFDDHNGGGDDDNDDDEIYA